MASTHLQVESGLVDLMGHSRLQDSLTEFLGELNKQHGQEHRRAHPCEKQEQRERTHAKTKGRRMTENNLEPEDTVPSLGWPRTGHKISPEQLAGLFESLLILWKQKMLFYLTVR